MINKLREAEVAIAEGSTVAEAARRIGVTEQTFYRWRSEYGDLRLDQVRPHSSLGDRPPAPETLLPADPV
ncbi:MAG: transposase, partial [Caldilineaceae bacterium]|nr:transposase [Caldilineaceae bacterium]